MHDDIGQLTAHAKSDVVPAQVVLGLLLLNGSEGVAQDYERARHWLSLAAARGASRARYHLAMMYLKGLGVQRNEATARDLLVQAASRGEFLAAIELGRIESSLGRVEEARHWYSAAAAQSATIVFCEELDEAQSFLTKHVGP